jgi:hypothetical protein
MKSQSFNINNIYLDSIGVIVSKKEKEGPLGKYFTHYIDDYYFNCKTFDDKNLDFNDLFLRGIEIN